MLNATIEVLKYFMFFFLVGYKPSAEMHTAHHMLMFGCQVPAEMAFAKDGEYWYVQAFGLLFHQLKALSWKLK